MRTALLAALLPLRQWSTCRPSGKFFASTVALNNRQNLVMVDSEQFKPVVLTRFTQGDVSKVFWANDERLLYTTGDQPNVGRDTLAFSKFDTQAMKLDKVVAGTGQEQLRVLPSLRRLHGGAHAGSFAMSTPAAWRRHRHRQRHGDRWRRDQRAWP